MYIESSRPQKNGDTAIFESPYLTPTPHCLSLWYNMHGRHINKLQVSLLTVVSWLLSPKTTKIPSVNDPFHFFR